MAGAHAAQLSSLALLSLAVQSCSASLSAWWVSDNRAPQILRFNKTLGAITYSSCHAIDVPVFPLDPPNVLDLLYKPRNGTSLTGQGWWNSKTTVASIFYQGEDGHLINTYQECDLKTGKFRRITSEVIDKDAPTAHATTGLASVLLVNQGNNDGYRVFYHDEKKQLNSIGYKPATSKFYYDGVVSQDVPSGFSLAAAFNSNKNYSVVLPRDGENMEHVRAWYDSNSRHGIATLPRPLKDAGIVTSLTPQSGLVMAAEYNTTTAPALPSWYSDPKLAMSTDSGTKRNVFWLGSDNRPHQIYISSQSWMLWDQNIGTAAWPVADAGSDLALACKGNNDQVRLYYDVRDVLHEIRYDLTASGNGYEWKPAVGLATVAPPADTTTTTTTTTTGAGGTTASDTVDQQQGAASGDALSTGAKIGLGVGLALGVVALGAGFMAFWYMRRLKKAQAAAAALKTASEDESGDTRRRFDQQQQQQHDPYQYQQQQGAAAHYQHSASTSQLGSEMGSPETTYHYGYVSDKKVPLVVTSPVGPPPPQEMNATPGLYELPDQRRAVEVDGSDGVYSPTSTLREGLVSGTQSSRV